jgi:hypothetical protein
MKRKITQWTLTMVLTITLVACATSARYASTSDDIYYSPTKTEKASIVKTTDATIEDAEIRQLKSETQAAIKQSAQRLATDSTILVIEEDEPYKSILSDSYEDSYERRLKGYKSPSYGIESSIRITTSSDWLQVTSYDPEFYNIIIMGDEIWVEPKYITTMFSPVRTTINLGYGGYSNPWSWDPYWNYGWGSWYSPWHRPYYNSYWGWGWNYGWNGHWGWGSSYWGGYYGGGYYGGYYGHGGYHNNHHWGLGRPTTGGHNTYGRRDGATMGQRRTTDATSTRPSGVVNGGTRRNTRNMELVTTRQPNTNGGSASTGVTAGNRRGNSEAGNRINQGSTSQDNTTGRITRDNRGNLSQGNTAGRTTEATTSNSRRQTQTYTRPATSSRQNYNEPSATTGRTSSLSNRTATSTSTNNGTYRQQVSGSSTGSSPARSVSSSSRYINNSGSSSSSNSSSSSTSRRSTSSSSSYSSPSSSSSSYSPSSSSSSSRSSGSSSSSSSSSGGGGSRRR